MQIFSTIGLHCRLSQHNFGHSCRHNAWIIDCLDKCKYTLIKQSKFDNKIIVLNQFSSLFLSTNLMLEKILSQDDKTGFAV